MKDLNGNIRREREDQEIPQEVLAFEIGMSQSQLSKVENGKKDISEKRLQRAANFLKIDISRLRYLNPASGPATATENGLFSQAKAIGLLDMLNVELNKPVINKEKVEEMFNALKQILLQGMSGPD